VDARGEGLKRARADGMTWVWGESSDVERRGVRGKRKRGFEEVNREWYIRLRKMRRG